MTVFIDGLQKLAEAEIPVYLCTGNHDPAFGWRRWLSLMPSNVHIFSATGPSFFCYERAGRPVAALGGRGFAEREWPKDQDVLTGLTRDAAQRATGTQVPYAIGVIHTGLDRDVTKAPVSPVALTRSGMDYWALGHFHRPEIVDDPANPHVVYSGCVQGCGFDETGLRGAVLVTLHKGLPNKVTQLPIASVGWEILQVNVDGIETSEEVLQRIQQASNTLQQRFSGYALIVRVVLQGVTPLHELLAESEYRQMLCDRLNKPNAAVFYNDIADQTHVSRNRAALQHDDLFVATYRQVAQQSEIAEDTLGYVRRMFAAKGLDMPAAVAERLDALEESAQDLVLRELGGDDR